MLKTFEEIQKVVENVKCPPFEPLFYCIQCEDTSFIYHPDADVICRTCYQDVRWITNYEDKPYWSHVPHAGIHACNYMDPILRPDPYGNEAVRVCKSYAGHIWVVQVRLWRKNAYGEDFDWGYGGQEIVPRDATNGAIVKRVLVCALSFAEHEIREGFEYKGIKVVSPHLNLEKLVELEGLYE